MEGRAYKTGELCRREGTCQCRLSRELQHYKKGDTFDHCPLGKETAWKRIAE